MLKTLHHLKHIVGVVLSIVVAVLAAECVSSYVLYNHYARLSRDFYPVGSPTITLLTDVIAHARGGHSDEMIVTIDHGPLFRSDKTLGYSLIPGRYVIQETHFGHSHQFNLTVNSFGRRITAKAGSSATRRLYLAGDSAVFGWGLNDDQTLPWLLQNRFPQYDVVNLSLTSYSTLDALYQLRDADRQLTEDDVVVLTYHPITKGFNTASDAMLGFLHDGFEHQLGDPALVHDMVIPFGVIDAAGKLVIEHYGVFTCLKQNAPSIDCPRRPTTDAEADDVTEQAFDAILDSVKPAHVLIAFFSGSDSDPVVLHLKQKGVPIADLRMAKTDPDALDVIFIDAHAGPFWHRVEAEKLADRLQNTHWGD